MLYLLGWYDNVVLPPFVPLLELDRDNDDTNCLLQHAMRQLPPLPDRPEWLHPQEELCARLGPQIEYP